MTLPRELTFSAGAQIFEQSDSVGPGWATGLNIRGSGTSPTDPIRIYLYGSDGKGLGAGAVNVKSDRVEIYGNFQHDSVDGTFWTFAQDASLTLPVGGVIKNSDGTTYGASSWPVTNTTGSSGPTSVSIGQNASTGSGINSVAIGTGAKAVGNAVTSIGQAAGANFAGNEGIFIGHGADGGTQNGIIILNATGSTLTAVSGQNNSFYVAPIRNSNSPTNVLYYNTTTKEVTYGAAAVNYTLPAATSSVLGVLRLALISV